jgi:hypothetical protein
MAKKKKGQEAQAQQTRSPKKKKNFAGAGHAAAMSVHLELLRCWMVLAAHLHRLPASC